LLFRSVFWKLPYRDSIPVIEIRGEGKPMSAAQIRHLEELSNGGPLDIKIERTWVPAKCEVAAKRKDFVTFHYKVFTEEGKNVYQTYGESPVTIQLGVGMAMPGLDKGLKGMCAEELRKLHVPYRLSRKAKSKIWKNIPNDEHWLIFNLEVLSVEPYSLHRQFVFLDADSKGKLTESGVGKMKKDYGKTWKNEDIDNVSAVKYYIRYFDINGDGDIDEEEFTRVMNRDEAIMEHTKSKEKGRKRDPGLAWILDFDNDGVVSYTEVDSAPEFLEKGPERLPVFKDEL
uniref:peptidylprolyl isomerase n=1 Tax=Angiostrongylus cantonensis TaxID=6313 RepID=A0A0K0DH70_ANGCA